MCEIKKPVNATFCCSSNAMSTVEASSVKSIEVQSSTKLADRMNDDTEEVEVVDKWCLGLLGSGGDKYMAGLAGCSTG